MSGINIIGVSQMVPFAIGRGVAASQAALLVAVLGGAAVFGSLLSGLLCNRIGAARTLVLIAIGLSASWALLCVTILLPPMVLAVLVMGACAGGAFPSFNVLAGTIFGAPTLPRVMGLYGIFTLPLLFGLSPAAGLLHDVTGNYDLVVMAMIIACLAVAMLFYEMARTLERRRPGCKIVPSYP